MRLVMIVTALSIVAPLALPGCSYNKQCFGDGVCKITKNGQTSWEGPPDKVAAYQAKEDGARQQAAELDQAYADAPRRGADQPIRVVVIANAGADSIVPLMPSYATMLEQELAATPRIEIVPLAKVTTILSASANSDDPGMGGDAKHLGDVTAVDENLTRGLRDLSGAADVVIVLHAEEKTESGFVSGGGGAGVAEVVRVELAGSLSSVYAFAPTAATVVGKSTAGIKLAGVGSDGKAGSGQLAGKRDVERDRPAIHELAGTLADAIATLAPNLPDLAAAAELRKQNGAAMLKGLLGG